MAQPDPTQQGSERGQRDHAGKTSEASDAGMKAGSQGTPHQPSAGNPPKDDVHRAPESGDKPEANSGGNRTANGYDQA